MHLSNLWGLETSLNSSGEEFFGDVTDDKKEPVKVTAHLTDDNSTTTTILMCSNSKKKENMTLLVQPDLEHFTDLQKSISNIFNL